MSKLFTLTVLFFVLLEGANVTAQTSGRNDISLSDYNTWNFGASFGLTYPRTDITGIGGNLGISLDGTRFLSHHFALQARFIYAALEGQDINRPDYIYKTTVNYDLTINAIFQSNNLVFLSDPLKDRLALFVSVGAGIINYTPDIWLDGGYFKMHGIYSQYSAEYDTFDYSGSTDFMLPIAVGAKYHISDKISLNLEYTYRTTNSDKLDGFFKLLSNNDSYSFFNVGIIFHLGGHSKTLEWENPRSEVYSELDALRANLQRSIKDSDEDGVPDMHDQEPDTPKGTKVYGDGRSVDTDGDNIPDRLDDEPFSTKNAKVDANGKEIRPMPVAPIQPPPPAIVKFVMPVIYFDYDSYRIRKENNELLGNIAREILTNFSKYVIISICDNSKIYNVQLSNKRAETVKKHLVKYYNIDPARLSTEVKFMAPDPLAPEKNRRVEVLIKN